MCVWLFGSILALSVCSADTSPKVRGFGEEALCISPIHTGIYYTDTTKWVGGNGICLW